MRLVFQQQDEPSDSLRGIFDECVQKLQLIHTDSTVTNLMQACLHLQDNKRYFVYLILKSYQQSLSYVGKDLPGLNQY